MTQAERYEEAINWLYDLQYFGMKLGLGNTRTLLSGLGNPQGKFRSVHVAGTNGKGSVCAFLTQILLDAGMKVGTYTSPHLTEFGERICVDGFPMTRQEALSAINRIRPRVKALEREGVQCTFFEVVTCMAFRHFARRKVDMAVVEVGMGGRLDSTNVITPELSIITNISREHTQHLGETLGEIASEKAGIIKKGVPVISAVPEPEPAKVIQSAARKAGARLIGVHSSAEWKVTEADILGSRISLETGTRSYSDLRIRLPGEHQALNAATSVLAAEALGRSGLPISEANILRGMASAKWPARLQAVRLKPRVIVDATHNPGGAETLARFLEYQFPEKKPVMVLAMLADKEVGPVVESLEPRVAHAIVSESSYHRRMKAGDLARHFKGRPEVIADLDSAVARAMKLARGNGTVLITGSIFTASEALRKLDDIRAGEIISELGAVHGAGAYPGRDPSAEAEEPPAYEDPFMVLISTILSQRTRDGNTHAAAEALFSHYKTPKELAAADPSQVERLIRPAGFYRQKARNIIEVSRTLRDTCGSRVPSSMEELLALPGVGRKTANCVLS